MALKIIWSKSNNDLILVYEDENMKEYLITRSGLLKQIKKLDYSNYIANILSNPKIEKISIINVAFAIIKLSERIHALIPNKKISIKEIAKYLIALYYNEKDPEVLKYKDIPIYHKVLAGFEDKEKGINFENIENSFIKMLLKTKNITLSSKGSKDKF